MRLGPRRPALLLALLLAGCAAGPRVVPVPAPGVAVEPRTSVTATADGIHYRLGDAPRVLTLPFAIERAEGARAPAA